MPKLDGKVVSIPPHFFRPSRIVINLGSDDGVTENSEFLVYALGDEIKDPDTAESLGMLEVVRGRGKAQHVQPKMTTVEGRAMTTGRRISRSTSRLAAITASLGGEEIIEDIEDIKSFDDVKVGDLVRVTKL